MNNIYFSLLAKLRGSVDSVMVPAYKENDLDPMRKKVYFDIHNRMVEILWRYPAQYKIIYRILIALEYIRQGIDGPENTEEDPRHQIMRIEVELPEMETEEVRILANSNNPNIAELAQMELYDREEIDSCEEQLYDEYSD